MKVLVLVVLLVAAANGRQFRRCELARRFKCAGLDGYAGISLADWVCLAKWASHYNAGSRRCDRDGSTGYGIFRMSNRWLCSDGVTPSANACHVSCSTFLVDINASIRCAKCVGRSYKATYWWIWRRHCQGRNVRCYTQGCGV